MFSKPISVTLRELVAVVCFIFSLAIAAGSYKTKFEDSQQRITTLTTTMEKLQTSVDALDRTMIQVVTRLDYIEKPKK